MQLRCTGCRPSAAWRCIKEQNMTYTGDANLEKLLKSAGETRSLAEIRETLKGIIAAPEDIAAPKLWLTLFKSASNKDVADQLSALKDKMADHHETFDHNK